MIVDEIVAILGYDVRGEGQLRRFDQGLDRAERRAQSFSRSLVRLGGIAAGAFAAIGGIRLGSNFVGGITRAGASVENLTLSLEALEVSPEAAQTASDFITKMADDTGRSLEKMEDLYRRSKAFGLDPQGGNLQKIIDSASKFGADLDGVLLALGQAQAKQKLQGEETLQLVERGIPVWNMLAEATGISSTQLQEMQQRGELGLEYVQILIDQMGRDGEGFSKKQADLFDGLVAQIGNTWTKFLRMIARSGFFDAIKGRMRDLRDTLRRWDEDGTLQAIAQAVSDTFTAIMNGAIAAGRVLIRIGGLFGDIASAAWGAAGAVGDAISQITGVSPQWGKVLAIGSLLATNSRIRSVLGGLARFLAKPLAIGALLVVAEDLKTFFEGGDSFIGKFDGAAENLNALAGAIDNLRDALSGIELPDFGDWGQPLADLMANAGENFAEAFANPVEAAIERVAQAIGMVADVINNVAGLINDPVGTVKRRVAEEAQRISNMMQTAQDFVDRQLGVEREPDERPAAAATPSGRVLIDPAAPAPLSGGLQPSSGTLYGPGSNAAQAIQQAGQPIADSLADVNARIQGAFETFAPGAANAVAHAKKMTPAEMAPTVINDNRQDNRDQSVHAPVTVHQQVRTVQELSPAAVRAAGNATGAAVANRQRQITRTEVGGAQP
ncbi:MAG: tape measure protein [Pseudomonadota bacterium]